MSEFDVVVIGAGPGGYVAAIRAAQLGLKTAIVDKQWLGGVCLNVGCIPSKALLRNAEIARLLREEGKTFGFSIEKLSLDYKAAFERSRQVAKRLTQGVSFLMRKNNIEVFMGTAHLKSNQEVAVSLQDGKDTSLKAKNIIIATGAQTAAPPALAFDGNKVLSYLEAILLDQLPKSAVIIGAGAIGVEFATIWNSYGVDVTIVEMMPQLVPLEDEEIGAELSKAFTKRGIKVLSGTKVEALEKTASSVKVNVSNTQGKQVIEAEKALVAIGFKPNSHGLGLEALGVAISEKGFIEVDDYMATNVKGIWAIGDVTGKLMLAHVASAQGITCAESIAGIETQKINYEMIPRATYCHPQIASFGLTEKQAQERGYQVNVGRFPYQANGKALGLGENSGWAKIITDKKYGEILGAHIIGAECTELLPELTLAQKNELTITEIARNVHAHPTLSEILMEAAHAAEGHAIHI